MRFETEWRHPKNIFVFLCQSEYVFDLHNHEDAFIDVSAQKQFLICSSD